jgi:hypothetical protein
MPNTPEDPRSRPRPGVPLEPAPPALEPPPAKRTLTRDEVEAQLQRTEASINRHVSALEDEVDTLGPSIKGAIFDSPLVSVGGALVAGLAVGLLFGGSRKSKTSARQLAVQALVNQYIDLIVAEAQEAVDRGDDPEAAVREALDGRVPMVVVNHESGTKRRTFWAMLWATVTRVGVGEAVSYMVGRLQPPPPGSPAAPPDTDEPTPSV